MLPLLLRPLDGCAGVVDRMGVEKEEHAHLASGISAHSLWLEASPPPDR